LKSIEQTVKHYEIAFDNWQIGLNEPTKREIKHRSTLIWNIKSIRARQQLLITCSSGSTPFGTFHVTRDPVDNTNTPGSNEKSFITTNLPPFFFHRPCLLRVGVSSMKAQQVDDLLGIVSKVVEYCLTTVGEDFKRQLENVDASPRHSFPLLSASSRKEVHTLSRKTNSELHLILQCTLAFMVVMLSTGSRPTEIARLKRDDFSWYEDPPRPLVHRFTGKNGNQRRTTKDIYTTVVPDKDISKCSLVHLSRYMALTEPTCQRFVFILRFQNTTSDDSRSQLTMILRRFTAVIETLFVIQNGKGLGQKKLHIFRSVCTRKLSNVSCGAEAINQFIGWKTGTMMTYFTDVRSFALNSTASYRLVGPTKEIRYKNK